MIILPFRPDASWRHPPVGTVATMLALLLIHIAWGRGDPEALRPYLLDFRSIEPLQWLTSGLLHAGWLHLIGNLVFLFVFGAIVEDYLGRWFIPVYLLLTVASGALEQLLCVVGGWEGAALGASSAIYGVIALAVLWAPQTRVSTFIWLILHRPMIVDIRVLWLAGGYMALEVISVLIQGGQPSSQFLHAAGIAVGLPLGLLILRQRWIETYHGDLLAAERPLPEARPAAVPWDEQSARLAAAVAARDRRVALAAYEVLRREHPQRSPDVATIDGLVELCEADRDAHRAAAIAGRALELGADGPALRLRLARIHGQHLGDAAAGMSHLSRIDRAALAADAAAEYDRLLARLQRRHATVRVGRAGPTSPAVMLALVAALAASPLGLAGAEAEPDVWPEAPAETREPAPSTPSPPGGGDDAVRDADAIDRPDARPVSPTLPEVALHETTGRVVLAGGAVMQVPEGYVYLPWNDVRALLSLPPPAEETPLGMVLAEDQLARLQSDRAQAAHMDEWMRTAMRFMATEGAIQVYWEEGWIDPADGLPAVDQLLSDFQIHANLINRRQAMGPGVQVTIDGWAMPPRFGARDGVLEWSFRMQLAAGTVPGAATFGGVQMLVSNRCHLGAGGVLRLLSEGATNDPAVVERFADVSGSISWESGRGFTDEQPSAVGERTGGLRRLILPRLVFGDPAADTLVYRSRGLGWAWVLVALPAIIAAVVLVRRLREASRPPPAAAGAGPRCPACGHAVDVAATRCPACGSSLLRRS